MMTGCRCVLLAWGLVLTSTSTLSDPALPSRVKPGIDVLVEQDFGPVAGSRVGLITNHTGLSLIGKSTIDLLHETDRCRLVRLFSPEHGIRGRLDRHFESGPDEKTGLPVQSLYGKTQKPTPGMLKDLDVLVFDIQDIGTRFYTYIGTMALAMQAAADKGVRFVVLDRPNPLGGLRIAGAVPDLSECGRLTSIYPIPTCHGMTVGELARLFNRHFGIGCNLEVVRMHGWERWMYFEDTGLPWVPPSPNMKTLDGAFLYPGFGISEGTRLSCGRGTDRPFEVYGAPYFDSDRILENLAQRNTPGLRFEKCSFVPTALGHKFQGRRCSGIRVFITDRRRADPVLSGLHFIQAVYETHPEKYDEFPLFKTLVGDREAWNLLTREKIPPERIVERWQRKLEDFRRIREKYLLY